MKKRVHLLILGSALLLAACSGASSSSSPAPSSEPSSSSAPAEIELTDNAGRKVKILPGSYKKVVCIGAGALRLYSYVGDTSLLSGVEDIDNSSLSERPKMFDNAARPYFMANEEEFKKLPSCGVGGPNAQAAEAEKILTCNPDIIISEYVDADKANALSEQIGVPVFTVNYGQGGVLNDTFYDALTNLGKIFATESRAQDLISFYKAENQAIFDRTKDIAEAEQKSIYLCGLGNWGTTNHLMTAQNYLPLNNAHLKNVVTGLATNGIQAIDEEKFAQFTAEAEMMVFDAAAVKNIKGKEIDFSECAAFKTGEVYLQLPYNAYYTNAETALINSWFIAKSAYPRLFEDINIENKANQITLKMNGVALYDKMKALPFSYGGYQKIANPTEFFK